MEYLTVPKLANKMQVSDNSVRRYIKNYPMFFRAEKIEGWDQYPAEATLKILRRISDVSQAGKRRTDVLPKLMTEFEVVEHQEQAEEIVTGQVMGGGVVEFGTTTLAAIAGIESALRELIEVIKAEK